MINGGFYLDTMLIIEILENLLCNNYYDLVNKTENFVNESKKFNWEPTKTNSLYDKRHPYNLAILACLFYWSPGVCLGA